MTDYLILLLSTDWFLPHWAEIGIDIGEAKKVDIQQGCRAIVDQILGGADSYYLISFGPARMHETQTTFRALLQRCDAELEVSSARVEWAGLTHQELTAAFVCAGLNSRLGSGDAALAPPFLDPPVRVALIKTWETYLLNPSRFPDICLKSETGWDIRVQRLLSSPTALANQLWRVLLNRRLRAFWLDLHQRLAAAQLQQVVSWYHAEVRGPLGNDRPELVPSYVE
jgi:hypothetical protein